MSWASVPCAVPLSVTVGLHRNAACRALRGRDGRGLCRLCSRSAPARPVCGTRAMCARRWQRACAPKARNRTPRRSARWVCRRRVPPCSPMVRWMPPGTATLRRPLCLCAHRARPDPSARLCRCRLLAAGAAAADQRAAPAERRTGDVAPRRCHACPRRGCLDADAGIPRCLPHTGRRGPSRAQACESAHMPTRYTCIHLLA